MTPTPKNLNVSNEELAKLAKETLRRMEVMDSKLTDLGMTNEIIEALTTAVSPLRDEVETANRKLNSVIKNYNEKVDQLSAAQSKIAELEQLLSGKNVEGMK